MADYLINVFLDDAKMKTIEGAGLAGQVKDIDGKKAIQVPVSEKEQKKLAKGFPGPQVRRFQRLRSSARSGKQTGGHHRPDESSGCDESGHHEALQPGSRQSDTVGPAVKQTINPQLTINAPHLLPGEACLFNRLLLLTS